MHLYGEAPRIVQGRPVATRPDTAGLAMDCPAGTRRAARSPCTCTERGIASRPPATPHAQRHDLVGIAVCRRPAHAARSMNPMHHLQRPSRQPHPRPAWVSVARTSCTVRDASAGPHLSVRAEAHAPVAAPPAKQHKVQGGQKPMHLDEAARAGRRRPLHPSSPAAASTNPAEAVEPPDRGLRWNDPMHQSCEPRPLHRNGEKPMHLHGARHRIAPNVDTPCPAGSRVRLGSVGRRAALRRQKPIHLYAPRHRIAPSGNTPCTAGPPSAAAHAGRRVPAPPRGRTANPVAARALSHPTRRRLANSETRRK